MARWKNKLAVAIIFLSSLAGKAGSSTRSAASVPSDIKTFCEWVYLLQEAYVSEFGSYADSLEILEAKQHHFRFPKLEHGYRHEMSPAKGSYRLYLINPERDTLVFSNSGELKRGQKILLSLAPRLPVSGIAASKSKPNPKPKPKVLRSKPKEPVPIRKSIRVEDTIPMSIGGAKFRLVRKTQRTVPASMMDETVEGIGILDSKNRLCFSEAWKSGLGEHGIEWGRSLTAVRLVGSKDEGLLLAYEDWPSATPSGASFRVLGMVNGCLEPLSAEISIYGSISDWNGRDTTLNLENDLLRIGIHTGYFAAIVPFKVGLKADTTNFGRFHLASGVYHAPDGSLSLETQGQKVREYLHPGAELSLSATPVPFQATEKAKVPSMEKIELLGVYLPIPVKLIDSPAELLEFIQSNPDSMKVKVRLDGKPGWIKVLDTQQLGFPASG